MSGPLAIEDLSASYGPIRALDGVSFSVPEGTITAVLGANGAGKTTLLRTITGLVRSERGAARYGDVDLTRIEVSEHVRHGVAHVPEGRGVIAELTVEENLRLGGLFRRDRAGIRESIGEVLELFPPLAERRRRSAHTLSGGERQMLAIGRALVARPRLLLLDEPSLGLAPRVTAHIMALLRRLAAEQRLTVLLVEQNARSALSVADRAVVLALGRVVMDDTAAAVGADDSLRHHYLGY
ncbi:MAG TPA: ABC transporter ATP-binding protein [Acidimicrobiales bacterium]|nr:ABC transporter ATP-binding protein [Acidimicrobiales bacterium]